MKSKIKTFEDACKHLGLDPVALPDVSKLPVKHQKAITANYKLTIIAEALNDGWQPNWNNWNEYKYYPWFEVEASEEQPAGSGFSRSSYVGSHSGTYVGSRLCYKSSELARYAASQFEDLYKDYLLIQQ